MATEFEQSSPREHSHLEEVVEGRIENLVFSYRSTWLVLILLAALIAAGAPIYVALGLSSLVYFFRKSLVSFASSFDSILSATASLMNSITDSVVSFLTFERVFRH